MVAPMMLLVVLLCCVGALILAAAGYDRRFRRAGRRNGFWEQVTEHRRDLHATRHVRNWICDDKWMRVRRRP
ncbi:hypothetical protein [Amycolatopsis viridis]|uniref:Secreted protein n=1 Tax=Amycolatopsis viridis TaxID=185678 RepID=A0ABX0STY7_9PSEU|nr:hypothetical protein [Amycolatopsis viridis]NIH79094.1 hypothetical protein [Amycolatopsis viridis]